MQKPDKQTSNFARVFGVFLQRDARLESSSPTRTRRQATSPTVRTRTKRPTSTQPLRLHIHRIGPIAQHQAALLNGGLQLHAALGHSG